MDLLIGVGFCIEKKRVEMKDKGLKYIKELLIMDKYVFIDVFIDLFDL